MVLSVKPAHANPVFRALADPTRRSIFERLTSQGEMTVHALTRHAGVSQPAVSKHLTVLKRAKLVRHRRQGRETHYRAQPDALAPMVDWLQISTALSGATASTVSNLFCKGWTDDQLNHPGDRKSAHPRGERVFPHPPEKLWRALTESPLLAQWMMNNDFEPVVGRKFQFRNEPKPNWNGIVDCEVLAIDPLKQLSYNWGVGGPSSGLQWVVLWTLTPAEGGTHLRMEQSGFTPDQKAAFAGADYGWQKFFAALEHLVNEVN